MTLDHSIQAPLTAQTVEDLWQLGRVVQDRWGLRWRADILRTGRAWQCRSADLRYWLTHETMATRGPLTHVRVDRVYAGPDAKAAREAGEAEDQAVVVDADAAEADPASDPPTTPGAAATRATAP